MLSAIKLNKLNTANRVLWRCRDSVEIELNASQLRSFVWCVVCLHWLHSELVWCEKRELTCRIYPKQLTHTAAVCAYRWPTNIYLRAVPSLFFLTRFHSLFSKWWELLCFYCFVTCDSTSIRPQRVYMKLLAVFVYRLRSLSKFFSVNCFFFILHKFIYVYLFSRCYYVQFYRSVYLYSVYILKPLHGVYVCLIIDADNGFCTTF